MSGKGSADVTGPAKSLLSANCRLGSFTVDECTGRNSPHALSIQPQVRVGGEYAPIQENVTQSEFSILVLNNQMVTDKDKIGAETCRCQVKLPAIPNLPWLKIKYLSLAPCVTPEICSGLNPLIDTTAVL